MVAKSHRCSQAAGWIRGLRKMWFWHLQRDAQFCHASQHPDGMVPECRRSNYTGLHSTRRLKKVRSGRHLDRVV